MNERLPNTNHLGASEWVNERFTWIGIGGNVGNLEEIFRSARASMSTLTSHALKASPIYRSDPWGFEDQAPFMNQVVGLIPKCPPGQLFKALLEVEENHGRNRLTEIRWGPRSLDLDILSWPDICGTLGSLTLPHPRAHLRRFVLQPWADLAPELVPCGHEKTVKELLDACPDTGQVSQTSLSFHG